MKYRILFLFISALLLLPIRVFASGDFIEDYDVSYAISPLGVTTVTQNIRLTNTTDTKFPKQFAVIIDTDKIKNVIAHDNGGQISPIIKQVDGKTEITLAFNEYSVGRNKILPFTLRYENDSITQKIGSIWEVAIPGIRDTESVRSYSV